MTYQTKLVQGWTMPDYETHYPQEFVIYQTNHYQVRQRQEAQLILDWMASIGYQPVGGYKKDRVFKKR